MKLFIVDAFTHCPFSGNPAAVCLLDEPRNADWMQAVATEMNLSETAFVQTLARDYALRWFTPVTEVKLCGHATLAAAHVLWSAGVTQQSEPIRFHTQSGHCCLGPYWAGKLGKTEMTAFQASVRGGEVRVGVQGDRVRLGGQAVTVVAGELADSITS